MKKLITAAAILLAALTLSPAAAVAEQTEPLPDGGVYAVVTTTDGSTEVDSAPSADELSGVDSYELILDSEPALLVRRTAGAAASGASSSGYFSVSFDVPGTSYEIFIAGLAAENVEELQSEIIRGHLSGSDFDIERLSFIDAEKTDDPDGDDELCWAASTADILTYTGWAAQADFADEDELFEALIAAYSNDGGHPTRALNWFFNGSATGDNSGGYYSYIVNYPYSGGFLRNYAADMLNGSATIFGAGELNDMFARLREGAGVSLGLEVYSFNGSEGGHAVTLWGYTVDKTRSVYDHARYISIFFTDSDSDELSGADRRDAPNILSSHMLVWDSQGYPYFDYGNRSVGYLDDYTYLLPYTPDTPYETDPGASRSKMTDPDLSIRGCYLSAADNDLSFNDFYGSGVELYFMAGVINSSDVNYSGRITVRGEVIDSSGAVVADQSRSFTLSGGVLRPNYYVNARPFFRTAPLPAGDYTVRYTLNPERHAAEAYYYNNTASLSFRVRDSYLLGDYDGSGGVDILDVTAIQRSLAAYDLGLSEGAAQRGDVNGGGLGILDATMIQRWLAGIAVGRPISGKQYYN